MQTTFLTALLTLSLPMPAFAATPAGNLIPAHARLEAAVKALEAADAEGSNGRLEACIPARGARTGIAELREQLRTAAAELAAVPARLQALREQTKPFAKMHPRDAESICAAPETAKGETRRLSEHLLTEERMDRELCGSIDKIAEQFRAAYASRSPRLVQYLPPRRAEQCRETNQHTASVTALLKQGSEACRSLLQAVEGDRARLADVAYALEQGCEATRAAEDERLEEKWREHERTRAYEKDHPFHALLCQGDPDCLGTSDAR